MFIVNDRFDFHTAIDQLTKTMEQHLEQRSEIQYVSNGLLETRQFQNIQVNTGSKLLSQLNQLKSTLLSYTLGEQSADDALIRAKELVPTISQLSDTYAMYNGDYSTGHNQKILGLCQAIQSETKTVQTERN